MKYLITESQIDNVIFKYLDNQDFIKFERNDSIYFLNSEEDEYAQIRYDKYGELCYINHNLINETSTFFSLGVSDSANVIGRWVEGTLQMKVTKIALDVGTWYSTLRVPYK